MAYEEEDKKSQFNGGVAHAIRIANLQNTLNIMRNNLRKYYIETETYGYQIFATTLTSLKMEAWGKANTKERKALGLLDDILGKKLAYFSPLEEEVELNGETNVQWNITNLLELKTFMEGYEKYVRDVLEKHKLNSPSVDDDDDGL